MARGGVSYHNVCEAANALAAKGLQPTVERVRAHLQGGSNSTIAPHLKRWKAAKQDTAITDGLPPDLVDSVKNLHLQINTSADQRIAALEEEKNKVINDLRQQLEEANTLASSSKTRQGELEAKIASLEIALVASTESLRDEKTNVAALTAKMAAQSAHIEQIEVLTTDLRSQNELIRQQSTYYQEQMAIDRQTERDQLNGTIQELREQVNMAHNQLSNLELRHAQLQQLYQNQSIEHKTEVTLLRQENNDLMAKAEFHKDRSTITSNKLSESILKIDSLDQKVAFLGLQLETERHKYAILLEENKKLIAKD